MFKRHFLDIATVEASFWSHPFTAARFVAFLHPSTSEKDTFCFTAFSTKVTGFVIVAGFLVSNGLT